jgi:hypothetical protein
MADIGAVPEMVEPGTSVIYGGGLINGYAMGFPIDFWIIFGETIILGVVIVYLIWRLFFIMNPVGDYFTAERSGHSLAVKFSKAMKLKLLSMKYAAQIMEPEDPEDTDKWKQTLAQSIGQLGSVNTVIVCDWHDWIENPILNEAIVTATELWNESHPQDKILEYTKFAKYLYDGKLKEYFIDYTTPDGEKAGGIPVKPYFIVDPVKIEQYMPKQRDAASFGGWLRREAQLLNKDANKVNMVPFLLLTGSGVVIFIISLIFAWMNVKG